MTTLERAIRIPLAMALAAVLAASALAQDVGQPNPQADEKTFPKRPYSPCTPPRLSTPARSALGSAPATRIASPGVRRSCPTPGSR